MFKRIKIGTSKSGKPIYIGAQIPSGGAKGALPKGYKIPNGINGVKLAKKSKRINSRYA